MLIARARPRAGTAAPWIIVLLILIFGALVGYQFWNRLRAWADPALLDELQSAPLANVEAAPTREGDWPQWRGPHRDGVAAANGLLTTWPESGPKVLWQEKVGAGYSCPVVVGGKLILLAQDGEDEAVVCRASTTGKEIWRFRYPSKYINDFGSGPRATPTVDGAFVYTVGALGMLHCLTLEKGEKVWEHDLLAEFGAVNSQWGVSFSPLVEGDLLYANPGGPNGGSLAAFHKQDGKLVWKALDDRAGYSSPMAVTAAGVRQILFFTASRLVSVSPKDGKLFWSFDWPTSYDCNVATPIVVGDYVFISSGYGKGCALLKIAADATKALKAEPVYENNQMCNHFASSVYYEEHLYGFNEATLTCMEFRTGKVLWKEKGFNKGSLMLADGHLIVLGENGKLALVEAAPEAYHEKANYRLFRKRCWTMPVLAEGKLYVRDEEELRCLEMKKREVKDK